jgi:1-deoxy-D-xylulose-5-phosphate synthase
VGNDGPTHHGVFDFSYLRLIPNLVHMAPRDEVEMRRMLLTAWRHDTGPIAMRYPRGETAAQPLPATLEPIPIGQGELLRDSSGPGLLLIGVGTQVSTALQVAEILEREGIAAAVVDARFVKPLDEPLLSAQIGKARAVITLEENVLAGGLGEAVLALMARLDLARPTRLLGAPDRFVSYGSQQEQLEESGLTPPQVAETARTLWAELTSVPAPRWRRMPA